MEWNVILHGEVIDTVWFLKEMDAEAVRRSLIVHDGFDPAIEVKEPQQ